MSAVVTISPTSSVEDRAAAVKLIWEFFDYLRGRNPELLADIDEYLEHQNVAAELQRLEEVGPAEGSACLLARLGSEPVGTLTLKPYKGGTCEMNRMYVTETGRGRGIGRGLVTTMMETARALGYTHMRLDSLNSNHEALPLYRSLGFVDDPDPDPFTREKSFATSLFREL